MGGTRIFLPLTLGIAVLGLGSVFANPAFNSSEIEGQGSELIFCDLDGDNLQDAVLVGAREGYYGESKFQIDLSTPNYVKMDRNSFKGLFGKFNPSRGDLVFVWTVRFGALRSSRDRPLIGVSRTVDVAVRASRLRLMRF